MSVLAPKIDKRNSKEILEEIKALVPFYAPEWNVNEDKEAGIGFLTIFVNSLKAVIDRLNSVPNRNFIAFLNMLGAKLLPAQPAKAPVTFYLSDGTTENVLIPKMTKVSAGDVIFETEKSIIATPATLLAVYSIVPPTEPNGSTKKDQIFEAPTPIIVREAISPFSAHLTWEAKVREKNLFLDNLLGIKESDMLKIGNTEYVEVSNIGDTKVEIKDNLRDNYPIDTVVERVTTFELFIGKNLQEHILYLGHTELFNITETAQITLTVSPFSTKLVNSVTWAYYGEDSDKKIDWYLFDSANKKDSTIVLQKNSKGEIIEHEVNGIKSRWIRCKTKNIAETKDITIDTIRVGAGCVMQVPEFYKLPPIAIRGVCKVFGKRLSKAGISTVEELLKTDDLAKILSSKKKSFEYYKEQAENILENAQKHIMDEEYENMETAAVGVAVLCISPDMAFYNDVPLDISQSIYPFGQSPRLYDTFYIASRKAFSKKGAKITLNITITMVAGGKPTPAPLLSWEYWDGNGWSAFKGISENFPIPAAKLTATKSIIINNFPEVKPTKVNGQENFWIRVRLIGGHYGQETKIVYAAATPPPYTTVAAGKVTPPKITNLTINYTMDPIPPQNLHHCLTYNNLEFKDVTEESKAGDSKSFKPFEPLEDKHQTMYLGFDKKLEEGPISIFLSLEEQSYSPDNIPDIEWECYTGDGSWVRLEVLDGTRNLTQAGIVEFIASDNLAKCRKFNKDLCWIRAVDVKDKFKPSTEVGNSCLSPKIKGIYPNTTWAIQQETIKDELLGSGDGSSNQSFIFSKTPVVSEEVWVNEINALSEEERRAIIEKNPSSAKEVKDKDGNVMEFWVKWFHRDDLLEAKAKDWVYQSDRAFGKIEFGDGTHGAIPPIGRDNIKANYTTGGGKKGNVEVSKITELKTSIPFVDKASNPDKAGGGSDIEVLEMALERMPQSIKNRGRAVTSEDFEWIARESARDIVRVKCIPNFNNEWKPEPGWVTVIVVPESKDIKPKPSFQLKHKVKEYIKAQCSNIISPYPEHIYVDGPIYVEVILEVIIYVKSIDSAPSVKNEGYTQLKAFLHPLTGGYEGRGWEFGRMPFLSDFFPILEGIEGVDYVESLSMKVKSDEKEETITEDKPAEIKLPLYTLIFSGEHKITVKWRSK